MVLLETVWWCFSSGGVPHSVDSLTANSHTLEVHHCPTNSTATRLPSPALSPCWEQPIADLGSGCRHSFIPQSNICGRHRSVSCSYSLSLPLTSSLILTCSKILAIQLGLCRLKAHSFNVSWQLGTIGSEVVINVVWLVTKLCLRRSIYWNYC